jgi:Tol biopolymer transport system component
MASLLTGFEYDIFISYRQKDNKGDRWVSEFVDALKTELESTFKEEISVYFDINPHDGLLETHDVNASLKEKLKCLIFIPIISRTYCDPKSFAWENEFKPFVEQASQDQFGLKIKLPNSNVANRVLPVRIHDLDSADIKLFESTLGGVLRSIDFVHKETGVNRQLGPNDDNIARGQNQIFYRDQINKVALAVKDIIESMKIPVSPGQKQETKVQVKGRVDSPVSKSFKKILLTSDINGSAKGNWKKVIAWCFSILMAITVSAILWFWHMNSLKTGPVLRLNCNLSQGDTLFTTSFNTAMALSPDGTRLAYVAFRNDTSYLHLRYLDEFKSFQASGTEFADGPFFSPDGQWVGFFADGNLKKVSVLGGAPQMICEAKDGYNGFWGRDNTIIYEDDFKGIMRVRSNGGIPEQLTSVLKFIEGRLETYHMWPKLLPGTKTILYTSVNNGEDMRIAAFSPETGKTWDLFGPGCQAQYIKPGYLVYAWKGNLLAVPFNLNQMKVTGEPVVILKGVLSYNNYSTIFCISDNGSLAFIPGEIHGPKNRLALVDHNGKSESLDFPAESYLSIRISPDGKNILNSNYQGRYNLWIYGQERGTISRFSDKEYDAFWGIWTPDGKWIAFASNLDGGAVTSLFRKKTDGSGTAERLTSSNYSQWPDCFSPDGKYLIYNEGISKETRIDIWMLPMNGDTTPIPILNSRFNEIHPALSPDGRWIAYSSDEPGQYEVFVCSFPDREKIKQISNAGGSEPVWAPDGKELYYRDLTGQKLMAVSFFADNELKVGNPTLLFQGKFAPGIGPWGRCYDIMPDGKHFIMVEKKGDKSKTTEINIIINWFAELKQLLPAD